MLELPTVFENYIKKFAFEGEFYYYHYVDLYKELALKPDIDDFHDLKDWYLKNIDGDAKRILERHSEKTQDLIKLNDDKWKGERAKVKLMVPSVNSLIKAIGMYDNE